MHSNTLQHTATPECLFRGRDRGPIRNATHCNTLQHQNVCLNGDMQDLCKMQNTATHCNKLQHTATHCNTRMSIWVGRRRTCVIQVYDAYKCIYIYIYIYMHIYIHIDLTFENVYLCGDTDCFSSSSPPSSSFCLSFSCSKCRVPVCSRCVSAGEPRTPLIPPSLSASVGVPGVVGWLADASVTYFKGGGGGAMSVWCVRMSEWVSVRMSEWVRVWGCGYGRL